MLRFDSRWLSVLALTLWVVPAAPAGAQDAPAEPAQPAEAAAPAAEPTTDLDHPEEQRKDAEDDKKREQAEKEDKKWRTKAPPKDAEEAELAMQRTMGRRTTRFITRASQLFSDKKYDESNAVLARLNPKRLNSYERAMVYKYQAYNAYGKEQVPTAIDLLRKALAENILIKQESQDILFQIAQMQMGKDDFEGAIATLKEWFAGAEKPGASAYFTLAICHYQLKDLDAALEPAKKAIEIAETPQQGWFQLLLAIYLTKEDYGSATPVLAQLLETYPDVGKAYWVQLATLYGVQKDIPRALAIMQLAHRRKLLDDDATVKKLATLLQSEDIPIRSVKVLEQGFEQKLLKEEESTYELLGNSWILAREADKAEPALLKAAELSSKGALFVRLGQVRLLKEDYDGAKQALKNALAKGGLDDPGSVELLLGITYYNAGQAGEARSWFAKSRRSEKSRPTADAWLKHIDEELSKKNGESGAVGL